MTVARLFLAVAFLAASACEDETRPAESPKEERYTLRLDHYESADPPTPLRVSNETLLLPLGRGEPVQELTREAPGDLVVAYTRVDCSIGDPTSTLSRSDIPIPEGETARLAEIAVDEQAEGLPRDWTGGACFALLVDGSWTIQLPPTTVDSVDGKRTSTLALDGLRVDAVAIFFPLYADVTEIRYRITD